jgi:ArsR family transcriptional regulator, arsenate/arsenite/antimonite-responsive transcriptional repressor
MVTSLGADLSTEAGVDLLRVLADPLRLHIVRLLAAEALCTCHLVEETGARQTNVSNHLRVLRQAGLVETEPCGRFTYYRLRPETLGALGQHLNDLAEAAQVTASKDRRRPCP